MHTMHTTQWREDFEEGSIEAHHADCLVATADAADPPLRPGVSALLRRARERLRIEALLVAAAEPSPPPCPARAADVEPAQAFLGQQLLVARGARPRNSRPIHAPVVDAQGRHVATLCAFGPLRAGPGPCPVEILKRLARLLAGQLAASTAPEA